MRNIILLSSALLVLFFSNTLHAQKQEETLATWRVETKDGNEYVGLLLSMQGDEIVLGTDNLGVIHIPKDFVRDMRRVDKEEIVNGEVWEEHQQSARYLWAPNGYGLRKGEGYYQNTWVLFNQVSVGLSDYFSLGLGTVPIFVDNFSSTPVWFTPKVSIPLVKDKFNVGGGILVGTILGDGTFWGVAYGVTTLGSKDNNVTIGLGYGFADDQWFKRPAVNVSAMFRVGKRNYLITENYIFSTDTGSWGLISFGGRAVWRKVSLDYGGAVPIVPDWGVTFPIPWISVAIPFGKNR